MSNDGSQAAIPLNSGKSTTATANGSEVGLPAQSHLLQQHLGLVLSGLLSLLLAVKLLVAGNYNAETALGILQVAGTSSVLFSTLVSVLPYLLVATFFASFNRWGPRVFALTGGEKTALFAALGPLTAILLFVIPLVLLGIVVAFILILFAVAHRRASRGKSARQSGRFQQWRMRRKRERPRNDAVEKARARTPESSLESAASQASVLSFAVLMAAISPWMPFEAVTVGTEDPVKAHVIGVRGDKTIFLPDGPTQGLVTVETSDVHREYCDTRSWASVTAFHVFREPAYDECPE